jgi:DNA-binding beta-propeller fold protein YncE
MRTGTWVALILALWVAGCEAPSRKDADAGASADALLWPRPPSEARIRFVKQIAKPADWGLARSGFQGFMDRVTGQRPFRFVRPTCAVERDGVLFVADPGAQALVILDPSRDRELVVTRAGPDALSSPIALAIGPAGTVLVADSALKKVFAFDRYGTLRSAIGGDGRLGRPAGLAYDARTDRLYISDSQAHRISVFTGDGRFLASFGTNGDAPGAFNFPTHIALKRSGELLVTDTLNFRVQVLGPDGEPRSRFGRAGDGSGDFASPKGVGADSQGNIYVVDALFDAVQVFAPDGQLLMAFGERGTRDGNFWLPNGLFVSADDTIYVADAYNQRISIFRRVNP